MLQAVAALAAPKPPRIPPIRPVSRNIRNAKFAERPSTCTNLAVSFTVGNQSPGAMDMINKAAPTAKKPIQKAVLAFRKHNPARTPATNADGQPIRRSRMIAVTNAMKNPSRLFRLTAPSGV